MGNQFKVEDFVSLYGEDLILIGGQAVNLWAERYVSVDPTIAKFQPFTSRDADFYRRSRKRELPPDWKQIPNPTKGRMRLVSEIIRGPDSQEAEILQSVNGLTKPEVESHTVSIPFGNEEIAVLSPIALFQAKLANVRTLDQENRQDLKHVKMLIPICRLLTLFTVVSASSWLSRTQANV